MSPTPAAGPPPDGKDPPLEALLAAYLPELQGYLRRRSQGLVAARESSSDLVQSVCREILTNLERFRHGSEAEFRNWVFRTADRKVVDRHRYYTAQRRDPARELGEPLDPGADVTPSRHAVAREEYERVYQALQSLPPHYREVVVLSRVLEMPHAEIAQRLGKSEGAVRNILSRALADISRRLAEHGQRPEA
jgi:RNA polymerase sigma-70 factor, ECF subfamily